MKNVLTLAGIFAILILVFLAFSFGKKKGMEPLAEIQHELDSIANIPPDTVIVIDTIIQHDTVVKWYAKEVPKPEPDAEKPGYNFYPDSLITADIDIFVNDTIQGWLRWRTIGYKLKVPKIVKETVTITEKVPVPVVIEKPVLAKGMYVTGGMGGGNAFLWTLGAGIKKNRNMFEIDYLRYNNQGNVMFKYSYLLFINK